MPSPRACRKAPAGAEPVQLVRLAAVGPGRVRPSAAQAHALHDVVWAHTDPALGLEHLRVSAHADHLGIALFTCARGEDLEAVALAICAAALARSPVFRGWLVTPRR